MASLRAGKMNQILHCDWLPKWARRSYLAHSGLPAVSCKKTFCESHIINPLLTKFVRSRWLVIDLILFFVSLWTLTLSRSINTQKKELGQYPAILTSHLVNNPYILHFTPLGGEGWCHPHFTPPSMPKGLIKLMSCFIKTPKTQQA